MIKTKFFEYFYKVCSVPRNSGKEEKIAAFLLAFAAEHGLESYTDEHRNVLISKPATPGYEDRPGVILQGHTDMVCVTDTRVIHDFYSDPIEYYEENGKVRARGTTLGADDGAAIALMLSLLDDDTLQHPALQCLFTAEEETGLCGATGFDASKITSGYMINIDSEEEGTAIVSCAGGKRLHFMKYCPLPPVNRDVYTVRVYGLAGGHSGTDINKNRTNANVFLAGMLKRMAMSDTVYIASFKGGVKDNAIASSAEAVIACDPTVIASVCNGFCGFEGDDSEGIVSYDNCGFAPCMNAEDSASVIKLLTSLYNGVIEMSSDIPGLVETSQNIGIVNVKNGDCVVYTSLRSADDGKKEQSAMLQTALGESLGFRVKPGQEYPGWEYKKDSRLRQIYIDAYKAVHGGKEPTVCALHAGLECGIFTGKLPALDIISIGPTMENVHTIKEELDIESVGYLCDTVELMLKNVR